MTTIYVCGYPKSGLSWTCRLLGDVLDSPVGGLFPPVSSKAIATEGQDRKGGHYVRQGHPMPIEDRDGPAVPDPYRIAYHLLTTERVVFIVRDPRDIMVSGAHHWGRDLTTYIHLCGKGEWPMTYGNGLVNYVRTWMASGIPDCIVRYEVLLSDTAGELGRILGEIGVSPAKELKEVVERQSFAKRKAWTVQHGDSLPYGKEFQLRFLRKGIVGDWRNVMDEKQVALCEHYFGDLRRELGYELYSD